MADEKCKPPEGLSVYTSPKDGSSPSMVRSTGQSDMEVQILLLL